MEPPATSRKRTKPESTSSPVIKFYQATGTYGCFSNFSRHPIDLDGKTWPTTEHYFQAQKFLGTPHAEEIRKMRTPMEAAKAGRDRSRPLRGDWDQVKDNVMRKALLAKFTQHEECKRKLLNTGDAIIIESTKNDAYWADNGDGTGKNRLGELLMELRNQLGPKSKAQA